MKNISKQYQDLVEGKMSRDNFVRNCRQQFPQFVSPVTSVDDAIKILKSKRIIAEAIPDHTSYKDPYVKGFVDNEKGCPLEDCPYNDPNDAASWKDGWMDYETEKQMDHDEETYNRETGGYGDLYREDINDDSRNIDSRVFKLQNQFTPAQLTYSLLKQGMEKWGNVNNIATFVQKVFPDLDIDDVLDMINTHKDMGSPTTTISDDLPFFENRKKSLKEAAEKSEGRYKEVTGKDQYGRFSDLDNVNFQTFLKALAFEIGQEPVFDDKMLPALMEKIAKKMKKDPNAYRELVTSNYAEIVKQDENLKMKEVKPGSMVDKENGMKEIKGQEKYKADSAPKTENRKGKPDGVKEMGITPKKAAGITAVMDMPGKEKVIDQLKEALKKSLKEDSHHKYTPGTKVETPDGSGVIESYVGGTATVKFTNGKQKDYQVNTLNHFENKAAEKNENFRPGVDLGGSFDKFKGQISDEDEFEKLIKTYDWYAEMSDDSRKWEAQKDLEAKLKALAKTIGADTAAEIWNRNAPKNRQVQNSYFMMREEKKDKYSKLKEFLKKAIKKEATRFNVKGKDTYVKDQDASGFEKELKAAGVSGFTKTKV